ncbi:MAG: DUF4838 domain-containing protein, partial [Lentisphaerae bacterium]|nr:DUF4838 domain-containing protein [Lentisphaerota bacterium]
MDKMRMAGLIASWLVAVVAMAARPAPGPRMILVEQGLARVPIIVAADATPLTLQAAGELSVYIEKISGVRPDMTQVLPDPLPDQAVWVGFQPKLREIFPDADFEFKHPEEVLLVCDGVNLAITGSDRWDPERLVIEGRSAVIDSNQMEYGTVNAVYTFLRDYLDVRWLWPGEEDIIKRETIALAPFEYRHHPSIRIRAGILRFSAPGDGRGISHDWVRYQRMQLDSSHAGHQLLRVMGGHGFGTWWNRFHETNPDFFAMQPDGTRSGFPGPGTVKMCQSNPDVWDQWVRDVEAMLEVEPERYIFNASPNDSYHRGHCVCEKCRAWDHPDGELLVYTWQGLSQEYVAMSDRHVTFANHLGRKLKERFPDMNYYVLMFAYGNSRPPPVMAVPDDNVIICSVANFHLRGHGARESHQPQFDKWGKVAPNLMWRPNLGNAYGWRAGWPAGSVRQAIEDMRFVGENNCRGIYFDSTWEHWAVQGPHYYMLANMAWDPLQDGWAVWDDFCRRAYGPAAAEMKSYWALLDGVRDRLPSEGLDDLEKAYRDETVFEKAYAHLDRAGQLVGDAQDYCRRLDFARAGLDFT